MRGRPFSQERRRWRLYLVLPFLLLTAMSVHAVGDTELLPTPAGSWNLPIEQAGRLPAAEGSIEIRGRGVLTFDPSEIAALRNDVFRPGHFSVFDILVHLADSGEIDLEFAFDPEQETHVITSLNGLEGWWFDAHYEGGSFDRTVVRMDLFPVKDGMSIVLYLEDPERLAAIEEHFRDEIRRQGTSGEGMVIPRVTLRSVTSERVFEDVSVTPHGARADVFQPGTVTMLDVLLSLGEQGALERLAVEWRDEADDAETIDGYFVAAIASGDFAPEAAGTCVLIHQVGGQIIDPYLAPHTHTMSHIHLTAGLEVLIAPESVVWLWTCL